MATGITYDGRWAIRRDGARINRMHRSLDTGHNIVIQAERATMPDPADDSWSITVCAYRFSADASDQAGYGNGVRTYAALPAHLTPMQARRQCDKVAADMLATILARAEQEAHDINRDHDHAAALLDPRQAVTWTWSATGVWRGIGIGGRVQAILYQRCTDALWSAYIDVYPSDPQAIGSDADGLLISTLPVAVPADVTDQRWYVAALAMREVTRLVAAGQFDLYPLNGVWAA